ncbi:MAG: (Fe-S)-binding protein [Promethearchaeota archaeon]
MGVIPGVKSPDECVKVDLEPLSQSSREALQIVLERCIRCNTCKASFSPYPERAEGFKIGLPTCPAGEKFKWEAYWASGKIRLARGLLTGQLEITPEILEPIFACPTCGHCMDNCQAPHSDDIVDIIEALREFVVKEKGAPERQRALVERVKAHRNPYGAENSDNEALKREHGLPDKADVVYFIGCTSNYRQQKLRDATISVFKKLGVEFTLVDEHCCGSPLIRTGQIEEVPALVNHNVELIKAAGAKTVVTSCAGCYRTLRNDFGKFGGDLGESGIRVLHTTEFLLPRLSKGAMRGVHKKSGGKVVTYHDPCHLGHHSGLYEPPRDIIKEVPGVTLVEMPRNRNHSYCCGAGGGVKIGYPDWALEISGERVQEACDTGAEVLVSTCPFCRTNLSDAREKTGSDIEVVDLVEILDEII